jgi:hypothetical protein
VIQAKVEMVDMFLESYHLPVILAIVFGKNFFASNIYYIFYAQTILNESR